MGKEITTSLIIATYNWTAALSLCLESVLRQTVLPDEIIVADDGSDETTAECIRQFAIKAPVSVVHEWHEDRGFRKTMILNKAIRRATCTYVIQIDGDIILHRHFIKDHRKFARKGSFVCGSRVTIQQQLSEKLLSTKSIDVSIWNRGVHNRINGIRIPLFNLLLQSYNQTDVLYVRGCNMGFWKQDLLKVNGYNELMTGWGREDSEIACRLINAGVQKRFIKFSGIIFHLFHEENSRDQLGMNNYLLQQTISQKHIWCDKGVMQYIPSQPTLK